ncbi:hypothetical protein BMS3Bbin01_02179 [bacterium BMS3Bbin01]|nr:hypothetical protein BMS3Bbin01_02179 [bacterium BMS3Bbin01]
MMDDQQVVALQLKRPLRAAVEVVHRCPLGLPVVVAVPPLLDDGTPFPTRYWLCCPVARARVGRIESAGGVRAMDRRIRHDTAFAAAMAEANRRYAAERDALIPDGVTLRPTGGVAGGSGGVKCLHAHYADHRAGNANPVGEMVAPWVEPLDCAVPCVAGDPAEINPAWSEPR